MFFCLKIGFQLFMNKGLTALVSCLNMITIQSYIDFQDFDWKVYFSHFALNEATYWHLIVHFYTHNVSLRWHNINVTTQHCLNTVARFNETKLYFNLSTCFAFLSRIALPICGIEMDQCPIFKTCLISYSKLYSQLRFKPLIEIFRLWQTFGNSVSFPNIQCCCPQCSSSHIQLRAHSIQVDVLARRCLPMFDIFQYGFKALKSTISGYGKLVQQGRSALSV